MHSTKRAANSLHFVFQHHHIFDPVYAPEEPDAIPSCCCSSCRAKLVLLPNICLLFFLGMVFPPIYFCLWSWQLYALIAYKRELNEVNYLERGREIEKEVEEEDKEDYDGSTLRSDNPFSDKYKISESGSDRTVRYLQQENEKYNFDAHCSINNRFNKWCGRSLIAFSCQVCLIVVITCAIVFANEKNRSSFPLQA